jgi:hypothetical protein
VFSGASGQIGAVSAREARAVRIIRSHIRALLFASLVAVATTVGVTAGPWASAQTTTVPPTTVTTPTTAPPPTTAIPATTTSNPPTPTTKKPSTTTTTKKPSTTTTAPEPSTVPSTQAPSTSSSAPAVLAPTSSTTLPGSTTGGGGMSAARKLQLVVGGLIVVGVGIGLLTFLYWRRTRPPAINTALDALADLDLTGVVVPAVAGAGSITATTPVVSGGVAGAALGSSSALPTTAVPTMAAAAAAPPGAGSGVRILGPLVVAGGAVAGATEATNADEPDPTPASIDGGPSSSSPRSTPTAAIVAPPASTSDGDVVMQIGEPPVAAESGSVAGADASDEIIEISAPAAVSGPMVAPGVVTDESRFESPEPEMLTIITVEDLANQAADHFETTASGPSTPGPAEAEDGGKHG